MARPAFSLRTRRAPHDLYRARQPWRTAGDHAARNARPRRRSRGRARRGAAAGPGRRRSRRRPAV
ncbi:MAG: hypothetical protein EPO49_00765 [Brevundimonas sp.]|nr:MAG: hypothetical protein EPO49_00765 [Brevundimonas sp.]